MTQEPTPKDAPEVEQPHGTDFTPPAPQHSEEPQDFTPAPETQNTPSPDPFAAQPQQRYQQQGYYGQPSPEQQQQYWGSMNPPYPPYGVEKQFPNNWQGILSLCLSAGGALIGFFLGFFTLPFIITGIVFGHLGLSSAKKGTADNKGLALAGMITGYAVIVLSILLTALVFIGFILLAGNAG